MEKQKSYFSSFAIIGILLIAVTALIILIFNQNQAKAQEDILTELTNRLTEQGVPVKNVQRANYTTEETNQPQLQISVVLQSTTNSATVAPEDPLYVHMVQREIAIAQKQNEVQFDTVNVTILNSSGSMIYWSDVPVGKLSPTANSQVDDMTLATMLLDRLSLHGFFLHSLSVSTDTNGTPVLNIQLDVEDVQTANEQFPPFMFELSQLLEEFNSKGIQIAICKIEIVNITQRQVLLKYVKDFQLAQENWWQAETFTKEWFPHPPPPVSDSVD
ncbi:MAG: hypothetical protein HND44_06570 [Chloroflexi bacterium]|nr:hypothetical protein [Ardenticatenaceae bacterium]MBL1128153.1 hypothetical protein [Chloroflexota bacterium]NOG34226.1 hypothetical protein [Chloroflexota bacterium]GIK55332.1 MAG: hypothetical protein BroJett015_09950 [Chloroflexota bacterium]